MKIGIVVNPVGAADLADAVAGRLGRRHDVVRIETTEGDPGVGQTARLVEQGCETIIACGGDGTVRACAESMVGTDAVLMVAPAGTGNLLALNFDLPDDPALIGDLVDTGSDRRIDTGTVNGETFLIMAGAGFDARIMQDTDRDAKDRFGSLAYVATALQHVGDEPIHCRIDLGDRSLETDVATVLFGNVGRLQAGIEVFPSARADDGLLDMLAIEASTTLEWVASAVETLRKEERGEYLRRVATERAVVQFDRPTPYQLDGESRDAVASLDVRIAPSSLTIRTRNGEPR